MAGNAETRFVLVNRLSAPMEWRRIMDPSTTAIPSHAFVKQVGFFLNTTPIVSP